MAEKIIIDVDVKKKLYNYKEKGKNNCRWERVIRMKATGVVRKIDELGRIVIPKEIRRTLKIRDGEALEIFVDGDTLKLRKFSSMEDLQEVSRKLLEAIAGNTQQNIYVADRDCFIAGCGNLKKKFLRENISSYLEDVLRDCENVLSDGFQRVELIADVEGEYAYAVSPILAQGSAIGLVLIVSKEKELHDEDLQMTNIVAQFLAKYVEE